MIRSVLLRPQQEGFLADVYLYAMRARCSPKPLYCVVSLKETLINRVSLRYSQHDLHTGAVTNRESIDVLSHMCGVVDNTRASEPDLLSRPRQPRRHTTYREDGATRVDGQQY